MPRAAKVKIVEPPHPLERFLGSLVRYYDNGWRTGTLEEIIKKKTARIRPMAGYKVTTEKRCCSIPVDDVQAIEEKGANNAHPPA